jgi:hypothetical protein
MLNNPRFCIGMWYYWGVRKEKNLEPTKTTSQKFGCLQNPISTTKNRKTLYKYPFLKKNTQSEPRCACSGFFVVVLVGSRLHFWWVCCTLGGFCCTFRGFRLQFWWVLGCTFGGSAVIKVGSWRVNVALPVGLYSTSSGFHKKNTNELHFRRVSSMLDLCFLENSTNLKP